MATGLTEQPPLTKAAAIAYVGQLLAFAKKIKATDPASAAMNLWMARNYLRNINNFA
jgi:hypothetical protein